MRKDGSGDDFPMNYINDRWGKIWFFYFLIIRARNFIFWSTVSLAEIGKESQKILSMSRCCSRSTLTHYFFDTNIKKEGKQEVRRRVRDGARKNWPRMSNGVSPIARRIDFEKRRTRTIPGWIVDLYTASGDRADTNEILKSAELREMTRPAEGKSASIHEVLTRPRSFTHWTFSLLRPRTANTGGDLEIW